MVRSILMQAKELCSIGLPEPLRVASCCPEPVRRAPQLARWARIVLLLTGGTSLGAVPVANAVATQQQVVRHACSAIADHVGAAPGPPIFLASYPEAGHGGESALATATFTYETRWRSSR